MTPLLMVLSIPLGAALLATVWLVITGVGRLACLHKPLREPPSEIEFFYLGFTVLMVLFFLGLIGAAFIQLVVKP